RRYAPKVRTGCLTCKIRRVKCDEQRPSCNRCSSTGRKCDGYPSPFIAAEPEPLSTALSTSIGSSLELRSFAFFREKTGPGLSGYFNDSVWDRYVLQLSQSEPTIRYAVNALAALHEERDVSTAGQTAVVVNASFPAAQYARALQHMRSLLTSTQVPMDVMIVAVILMIHFEALRESFVPAIIHAEHAIRLLSSNTSFDPRKIDPALVRTLMRIDVQGSTLLGERTPGLPFHTAFIDSTLPTTISSPTHARDVVATWSCRLYHFMRMHADRYKFREPGNVPIELLAKSHELAQTLHELERLLWMYTHKPTVKLSAREQHGLALLRVRVKMDRITAATCLYAETTVYDPFLTDYEDSLAICVYVLGNDEPEKRFFSVATDEGLLIPLYFIATHCRESRVRHQALAAMKRLSLRKGIWHVETMTRNAELIIRFEEALCDHPSPRCEDIPEWRRIHSTGFEGWDSNEVSSRVTTMLRLRPNGADGEWLDVKELIDW
ncbi:hypothetical protein BAUCODRAFT_45255, partial [Baudoinia panamericana UAMH 10762]